MDKQERIADRREWFLQMVKAGAFPLRMGNGQSVSLRGGKIFLTKPHRLVTISELPKGEGE